MTYDVDAGKFSISAYCCLLVGRDLRLITQCQITPETPNHYFFICNQYTAERDEMLLKINRILQTNRMNNKITLDLILHGSEKLSYTQNTHLFNAIHSFIRKSGRNPWPLITHWFAIIANFMYLFYEISQSHTKDVSLHTHSFSQSKITWLTFYVYCSY